MCEYGRAEYLGHGRDVGGQHEGKVGQAGPSFLRNSMASIPPAVILPPDWDRPLRNPIAQNITPAPVSLYKGKSCEINSPLPAGPSVVIIESLISFDNDSKSKSA